MTIFALVSHNPSTDWQALVRRLHFSYQPVVNIHTGATYGVEALLRGWDKAGFRSIQHVFDAAHGDGVLSEAELQLLGNAIAALVQSVLPAATRLFYNVDNRSLLSVPPMKRFSDAWPILKEQLGDGEFHPARLHIEISERHPIESGDSFTTILRHYKRAGVRVVIDDFGAGYAGLQLLHSSEPDMIKIDRFFIDGINTDAKKRMMVANVVNIAHIMGACVVAEGVETIDEFSTCLNIGCDFAQGHFVAPPVQIDQILERYDHVAQLVQHERRRDQRHPDALEAKIERPVTVTATTPLIRILEMFRKSPDAAVFPVISDDGHPLGLIREKDLKSYVYSPYGISLLMNQTTKSSLRSFISRAPVADLHMPVDQIVELYAADPDADAVIITDQGAYCGVLTSRALLEVISEQEIARARDQNPLSRLSGNNVISRYIVDRLANDNDGSLFAYLDFNNFKSFNDAYGFRSGDRIIVLFADMLKELQHRHHVFVGHIGGDDFFLGFDLRSSSPDDALGVIASLIERFTNDALTFYPPEDRSRGYLVGRGRDGRRRRFGLLGLSAAVLLVRGKGHHLSPDDLSSTIAKVKQQAKTAETGIATVRI